MNTSDAHTSRENTAELGQDRNLTGDLPEQAAPDACDIQKRIEIEKLLGSDQLASGYVYQGEQRTEYLFRNTPENIASFIGSRPFVDQIIITDAADWPILSTIGYFIDKCPDQELLDEIKKTLIPIQRGEAQAQPFFCPTLDEVEGCSAQREFEDEDMDMDMGMGMDIDPDLGF